MADGRRRDRQVVADQWAFVRQFFYKLLIFKIIPWVARHLQ